MKRSLKLIGLLLIGLVSAAALDLSIAEQNGSKSIASLYASLARENLSSPGQEMLRTLSCERTSGDFNYFGTNAFDCRIETICGQAIKHVLFYSRIKGAFTVPDPFAEPFARECPAMLSDNALNDISVRLDQGG
jgi:hypothetical protein